MKDFKGAAENYSDALLLEPNAAYLHRNRGMARYRLKDYRRAVEDASRAVELDPKFVQAWFDRAYARQKLKDAAGALEDCARAIALAPDARSFRVRSDIRRFLGDARGASEDADRALQLDPRDPWSHLARGLTREMSGDFAGAVKDYGEGLRIEPNHARCLSSRGYARSILGDRKEALEDLEASCASEPKDEEMPRIWIYLNRARDGDEQAAVELDARVRKWTEARPDGWTTRLGRFFVGEETEAALLRAAEDPVHEAQFYVGMRRLLAGHLDGAAMAFRKCVSLGGNDWAAQASKVELARLPRTERKAIPIRHASPSFRLTIPAGYSRAPVVPPNAAYAFTRTIEDRPDSVFALSLEVLRGMIRRDKPSEADVALLARTHLPPGATFVLRKEKWGEFDIDLMETRMHQNGLDLITLVVQVPLAPQALQIAAAGPAALESKVHADLLQVLSSVEGQSSWLTEGERTLALATGLPTLIGWVLFVVYGLLVLILFRGEPLRAWRFRFAWLATAAACLGVGFVLHLAYQDARGRDPSAFLVPVAAVYCGVLAARILRRSRTARVRLAGAGAEVDATPAPSKRPLSPAVAALLTWFAVVAGGVFLFQALGLVRSTAALEKLGSGLASMGFLIAVVAYVGARRRLRAWEEKGRTPVRRRREPRLPVPDGRCRRCRAAVPDGERPWEKLGYCSLDCLRLQRK
jgi:lipoprotein NlpI